MLKEIEIKDEAQVEKINRLACDAPYEVWLFTDDIMLLRLYDAGRPLSARSVRHGGAKGPCGGRGRCSTPVLSKIGRQNGVRKWAPQAGQACGACFFVPAAGDKTNIVVYIWHAAPRVSATEGRDCCFAQIKTLAAVQIT